MAHKVAIIGAADDLGREVLDILAERRFPPGEIAALTATQGAGRTLSFGSDTLKCRALEHHDFRGTDLALMVADEVTARQWAPKIVAAGALVIDTSGAFRMDRAVPLVVPQVNGEALAQIGRGIIASPGAGAVQLALALKPLHMVAVARRVVLSTYQGVADAGKDAADELFRQARAIFVSDPVVTEHFPKQIAFNVIPQIDDFLDSGLTREEWRLAAETQKILDPDIQVTATCVRVPLFRGHAQAVTVEFEKPITATQARAALRQAPDIQVVDRREDGGYVTPVECAGEDAVFVSRIRKDPSVDNGLSLWIVADNLRRGTALNAVEIAQALIARKLLKGS